MEPLDALAKAISLYVKEHDLLDDDRTTAGDYIDAILYAYGKSENEEKNEAFDEGYNVGYLIGLQDAIAMVKKGSSSEQLL